jgi:regulator of protease activity HflC (stomatin/prohibitin superfamily)
MIWNKKMGKQTIDRENSIAVGLAVLFSIVFLSSGTVIKAIPAGNVGVVFNLFGGVEKRVLYEGLNFVIPFTESVTLYDARKTAYSFTDTPEPFQIGQSIKCQTNDGQQIGIDVTVITHLNKENIWKLHQDLGKDYAQRLIVPQTRSIFRNIVAEFPVETVYNSHRNELTLNAQEALKKSFIKNGVVLDELLIRGIYFSESFAEAVEKKQIALQESQRQSWIKKTAEREKERRVIEGEGDAKALEVRGQALKMDPRIAELEFLEQLEHNGKDIPVVTGTKNAIISIGDILKDK